MATVSCSWKYSVVPEPNGTSHMKIQGFAIAHADREFINHQVIGTITIEFPNSEIANVLLSAIHEAVGKIKPIIIPAAQLPA